MSQIGRICQSAVKESERIRNGIFIEQCAEFNDLCYALIRMDRESLQDENVTTNGSESSSSSSSSSSSLGKRKMAAVMDADEAMRRVRQLALLEIKTKSFEDALKELKKRVQNHHNNALTSSSSMSSVASSSLDPAATLIEIMTLKTLPSTADELTDQQLRKSEVMREYRNRLQLGDDGDAASNSDSEIELNSDGEVDEEDLERQKNKVPEKCSISLQPMKDPVQFIECGHIFSREGIMSMFKNKHSIKCPGGCQKIVKPSGLREVKNESQKRMKSRRQFNESFLGSQVDNYDWA